MGRLTCSLEISVPTCPKGDSLLHIRRTDFRWLLTDIHEAYLHDH